jgi:hypothetical protein
MQPPAKPSNTFPIVVLALCVTALICIAVYLFFIKDPSQTAQPKIVATSNSPDTDVAASKKPTTDPLTYYGITLPLQITSYSISGPTSTYPEATSEGWKLFQQWSRQLTNPAPVIDPATGSELQFTSEAPKAGEIQYVLHSTCASLYGDFRPLGESSRTFAFRVLVNGDILCKSNAS